MARFTELTKPRFDALRSNRTADGVRRAGERVQVVSKGRIGGAVVHEDDLERRDTLAGVTDHARRDSASWRRDRCRRAR